MFTFLSFSANKLDQLPPCSSAQDASSNLSMTACHAIDLIQCQATHCLSVNFPQDFYGREEQP